MKVFLPFVAKLSLRDSIISASRVNSFVLDICLRYEHISLFLSLLFRDLGIESIAIDNFLLFLLVTITVL